MAALRGLVSKKKVRFQEDGFDLDLTYITPRIIAMGAPSEGREAAYRNPMPDVQRFFETRHKDHYRIYDLRGEKGAAYDPAKFDGHVVGYRFFDHNPAPLKVIADCCADMHAWMSSHPLNVVAVHCKAGKGRTGLIISAYLVHAGLAPHTTAALKLFGDIRTHDGKGVTIPSQMRYVHYYEAALRKGGGDAYRAMAAPSIPRALGAPAGFGAVTYRLKSIRLHTVPQFDLSGGCDPYFDVRLGDGKTQIFNWYDAHNKKVKNYRKGKVIDFDCARFNIRIRGDVKVVFYDADLLSDHDKMFHFWFNTGFVCDSYLCFHKEVLDRACKDRGCKEFAPDFKCELFLEHLPPAGDSSEAEEDDELGRLLQSGAYLEADNDEDLDEEVSEVADVDKL